MLLRKVTSMTSFPDSFCSAPFVNLELAVDGKIKPCCMFAHAEIQSEHKMPDIINSTIQDVYNGPEMTRLRQAFLRGEKPKECERCWKEEAVGNKSFRQTQYPKTVELQDQYYPTMFDLKLSNICNLKCRMCAAKSSSLIQKEKGDQRYTALWLSNKILGTPNEQHFLDNLAKTTFIELTGGEPFVSPENKKLIELISNTEFASNISIRLTTNGMVINKDVIKHLKKFKHASVTFSIDDLYERLYYSRSGAIHDQIISNLRQVQEANILTQVYCTISNYNVWFLPEFDTYFRNVLNYNDVFYGHLSYPEHMSIQSLPRNIKNLVAEKLSDSKWSSVVHFMMSKDINTDRVFIKRNRYLDNLRNTNFKKTYGEWAIILNELM